MCPSATAQRLYYELQARSLDPPWVFPSPLDPNRPMDASAFVDRAYLPALRKTAISEVLGIR